ncbi:MAG: hypothetical protein MR392_08350 [Roseburia sp.]|nr:hypothetical protein [Roseburia sp.]
MMNTVRLSYETIGEDNRTERSMNMQAYISTYNMSADSYTRVIDNMASVFKDSIMDAVTSPGQPYWSTINDDE